MGNENCSLINPEHIIVASRQFISVVRNLPESGRAAGTTPGMCSGSRDAMLKVTVTSLNKNQPRFVTAAW
jgi:hypothetical protein